MRHEHTTYLACPTCSGDLEVAEIKKIEDDSIESGILRCCSCKSTHNIFRHIPRFVPIENYSSSFGFEWEKHSKTQYDSYTGVNTTVASDIRLNIKLTANEGGDSGNVTYYTFILYCSPD